jgi:hypothetical protein
MSALFASHKPGLIVRRILMKCVGIGTGRNQPLLEAALQSDVSSAIGRSRTHLPVA